MASIPLFLLLSFYALYISMATRISPLFLDLERPALRLRTPFDTSNYGKLQLNNGLALTPQMGFYTLLKLSPRLLGSRASLTESPPAESLLAEHLLPKIPYRESPVENPLAECLNFFRESYQSLSIERDSRSNRISARKSLGQ